MDQRYDEVLDALSAELNMRLARCASSWGVEKDQTLNVSLAPSRDASHGDFATAVALAAAKVWKRNPLQIAEAIAADGVAGLAGVAQIEAVKPGFINITMATGFWGDVVRDAVSYTHLTLPTKRIV